MTKRKFSVDRTVDSAVKWIRQQISLINKMGWTKMGCVFNMSGSLESSVVAILCKMAFPEDSLGIVMPIENDDCNEDDARLIADTHNISVKVVDLTSVAIKMLDDLGNLTKNKDIERRVKDRLRMLTCYHVAEVYWYVVVSELSGSKINSGEYTKFGNQGDIYPLGGMSLSQIADIAEKIGVPDRMINGVRGNSERAIIGKTYPDPIEPIFRI